MTKILIAEDDQDIRELVVLTLQFSNFDVVAVEDGSLAVKKAKAESFDLILMNYIVNTFFTFLFYIIFVSIFKFYLKGIND
mgnify:CR=1 FL=1